MSERPGPGVVNRLARASLRGWGTLTADLRAEPDYIVIGTKRGGTTSLAAYLYGHPSVTPLFPERLAPKGVRYFDEHYDRGDRWYRSHFATVLSRGSVHQPRKLAGESTANYLFHPRAAERAAHAAPDAKILVLVRDPVERAWSHWRERSRLGVETLSFEDALDAEEVRLGDARVQLAANPRSLVPLASNFAYRAQGCYADLLPSWFDQFPEDQIMVVVSEDLYADPAGTYARVLAFLGLAPFDLGQYEAKNYHPPLASMEPASRQALEAFYAPHNRRLEAFLARELSWSHRRV